jgi:hypothetical protein
LRASSQVSVVACGGRSSDGLLGKVLYLVILVVFREYVLILTHYALSVLSWTKMELYLFLTCKNTKITLPELLPEEARLRLANCSSSLSVLELIF